MANEKQQGTFLFLKIVFAADGEIIQCKIGIGERGVVDCLPWQESFQITRQRK